MFSSFGQIARRPQLLVLSLMIFAQGSAFGATIPYLSVTAIGTLGMSDQAFSLLVLVSSVSAVVISVSLGILSDLLGDRRHMLIAMSSLGVIGYGAIYLFPSVPVFLGATSLVVPFFYATSSLLFASARLETGDIEPADAASINGTLRAVISAAWVITPAGLGLALGAKGGVGGAHRARVIPKDCPGKGREDVPRWDRVVKRRVSTGYSVALTFSSGLSRGWSR